MAKVILTTDATLMSEYDGNEFVGFAACAPALIPEWLYSKILCPPVKSNGTVAAMANCGTRKIEAALLENGLSEDDVLVVRPHDIRKAVTSETRVVGITSNDPLGLGPASSTFSDLMDRRPYSAIFFEKIVRHPAIRKRNVRIIVGGPGAWQIDEKNRKRLGIDCVFTGEGEITAPKLFDMAMNGNNLPRFVHGDVVPLDKIPNIKKPTINGLVEIARGCGRGCRFCNPTMLRFRCRPVPRILEEIKVNLDGGCGSVLLHAEDVLRYKAKGAIPNPSEVIKLFREVKKLTPRIGISHFAFASVLAKPKLIADLSELLGIGSKRTPWYSGQVGIETGSARLAKKHLRGKAMPFNVERWPELVKDAHSVLAEHHWVPCSTLILGMPGERAEDVEKTKDLVYDLREYKSLIVPLFFVPIGTLNESRFFRKEKMLPEHWKVLGACMEHNFRWVYKMSDQSFKMVRTPFWKRVAIKGIIKILEKKLKPYIMRMNEGISPIAK